MSELTDDQLDGLFRKSAEEVGSSYDPAAWRDMEARLDANDRRAPVGSRLGKNRFRWGLLIILLLLITGLGWYAYTKTEPTVMKSAPQLDRSKKLVPDPIFDLHQPSKTIGTTKKESVRPLPVDVSKNIVNSDNQPVPTTGSGAEAELVTDSRKPVAELNTADKTTLSGHTIKSGRNRTIRSQPDLLSAKTKPSQSTIQYASVRRRKESGAVPKQVKKVNDYGTGAFSEMGNALSVTSAVSKHRGRRTLTLISESVSVAGSPITGTPPTRESIVTESIQPLVINKLTGRPARWSTSFTFIGRAVVVHPDTTARASIIVPSVPIQKGFSIRLAVAPDLSTIGLKNFTRPGTNIGLLLEYRLAKRWSVQTGVIQSTKIYKAGGDDYVVPEGMWSSPGSEKPAVVDGRCNMLDIPLNVRYDLVLQPRKNGRLPSRGFISGGLTTYIMNKEDYHYTYSYYVHGQKTDWSTSTGGYGFSNLNLSVGYEQALSKRLFWQVEPSIKVPLKGVGAYKIDLLSTGAFFSIRYKL